MKICLSCEGISATELQQCGSCGTELLPIAAVHYPLRRGEEDAGNPLLGSRVDGKFRIANVLGKGGMGTVFRAVHEVSLVPVALKILHPRYAVRGAYREGFLAEARKAGRVVHENCARILDVGEAEDGTVYIAQELVEGETLDEWIHAGLAPAAAVEILVQLCRALVAAHAVGLVHRDLSTRNIMVLVRDRRPLVKVLDFGIAKGAPVRAAGEEDGGDLPPTASFGNPAYSAPEQLAGRDVDARADLYSLGVIAYESLCGELPVTGATGRELARATVEGRLKPLPNLPGVPAQLHHLVGRLLSRDPARRPASATEVLGILERLRRPRGLAVKRAAVGLLIAAVVLITVAYWVAPPPYLRLLSGQSIVLSETPVPLGEPVQEVRSVQLENLTFDFAGFDPSRLRVQVFRGLAVVDERPLRPEVGPDGSLILSTAQPEYRELLALLARERGPLGLTFRVDRVAPLRYARVLVDDQPPTTALRRRDELRALTPGTQLDLVVEDSRRLDRVWLEVSFPGAEPDPLQIDLPDPRVGLLSPIGLLRGLRGFEGIAPIEGPVTLQVKARDRAGNESGSDVLAFEFADLGVPRIDQVSAPGGGHTVTYGPGGTTLSLTLDQFEPGLKVHVRGPDETVWQCAAVRAGGTRVDVRLQQDAGGAFTNGGYEFQLEDRAGNLSNPVGVSFSFREQMVAPEISPATDNAAVLDGLVVTDGREAELQVQCEEPYRIEAAAVRVGGGFREVRLAPPRPGTGIRTMTIGPLDGGRHRLSLTSRDVSQEDVVTQEYDLVVMPAPAELRLPDTRRVRFLSELVRSLLFTEGPGGALEQGTAWNLLPADWRLVRGKIWLSSELPSVPRPVPSAGNQAFGDLTPFEGENNLDLALRDVLGRPVRVLLGEEPAPPIRDEGGTPVYRVARFFHHGGSPAPRLPLRVEHDQPARLVIDSPLPFEDNDRNRIFLEWTQGSVSPRNVDAAPSGGAELEFGLRFPDLQAAVPGLETLDPREYGAGHLFGFPVTLDTPAGSHVLQISLKTARSVLPEVFLEDLARRSLPHALAGLRMVPALAPPTYNDPVRADLSGRALYRTTPVIDVRNTEDVYLQGAELTRAQYEAAVQAFFDLPVGDRGEWEALVHGSDPLLDGRLTEEGLLPTAWGPETWRRMLESGERPVTGVDFFQAHTLTRILGLLVAGDPGLFRLPLGLELEMAALGGSGSRLNGLSGAAWDRILKAHEDGARLRGDPEQWPPTAGESEEVGDFVRTPQGFGLVGLDFGVREWVLDLPYNAALDRDEALLREWLADHRGHVNRALDLAGRTGPGGEVDLLAHLATFGVVRGLATGEPEQLIDGVHGPLGPGEGSVPAVLPGVVRVLQLRRDGGDLLPGRTDPRLDRIGFRLAGGQAFVREVRNR